MCYWLCSSAVVQARSCEAGRLRDCGTRLASGRQRPSNAVNLSWRVQSGVAQGSLPAPHLAIEAQLEQNSTGASGWNGQLGLADIHSEGPMCRSPQVNAIGHSQLYCVNELQCSQAIKQIRGWRYKPLLSCRCFGKLHHLATIA